MTEEFKILFSYNSCHYKARVVKSFSGDQMTYAVRPLSTTLVKGCGPQTLIYEKNDHFICESKLNQTMPDYIAAIVKALQGLKEQKPLRP